MIYLLLIIQLIKNTKLSSFQLIIIISIFLAQPSSNMFFSGIDSQLGKTGESFKSNKNKIFINQRFILKKIIDRCQSYNIYEGIDLLGQRFVNIYVKPVSQQKIFSKQIKEELRNKISPPSIWTGTHKIQKFTYMIEVHEKYGPTLKDMFSHINKQINQKDFIHLFYQLIKLVQKIGSGGFVHRELAPSNLVFDPSPQKNELYILNTLTLKKKNEEGIKLTTKYCSKGSHLGLNATIKDDLQSICYIMLDIYSCGGFLKSHNQTEYENAKSLLEPKSVCPQLPTIFLDFYYYVMGMNYTDEINYFHWKNLVLKTISKEWITRPYTWMLSNGQKDHKQDGNKNSQNQDEESIKQQQLNQIIHEQKQNFDEKMSKFVLQSKVNSMKTKLKNER